MTPCPIPFGIKTAAPLGAFQCLFVIVYCLNIHSSGSNIMSGFSPSIFLTLRLPSNLVSLLLFFPKYYRFQHEAQPCHCHFRRFIGTHYLVECIHFLLSPWPLQLLFESTYGHGLHTVNTCSQTAFDIQSFQAFHAHLHSNPSS